MKTFIVGLLIGLVLGVAGLLFVSASNHYNRAIPPPAPSGDQPVVQVVVDESYLGQHVVSALAESPEYSDPVLDVREPNLALLSITTDLNGTRVRPTVTMRMGVHDGLVLIDVVKVDVGGLNVPLRLVEPQVARLEQSLEGRINTMIAERLIGNDLWLAQVTTSETTLVADLGQITAPVAGGPPPVSHHSPSSDAG